MKYIPCNADGLVEVEFENSNEVETVRRAFEENIARLRLLGNDGSISEHHKWIAAWTGPTQTYKAPKITQLIEPLNYFAESTEEKVDELLDLCSLSLRIRAAAKRYEFGYKAGVILMEIEQNETGRAVGSVD